MADDAEAVLARPAVGLQHAELDRIAGTGGVDRRFHRQAAQVGRQAGVVVDHQVGAQHAGVDVPGDHQRLGAAGVGLAGVVDA